MVLGKGSSFKVVRCRTCLSRRLEVARSLYLQVERGSHGSTSPDGRA
jgi:hypothetical protein